MLGNGVKPWIRRSVARIVQNLSASCAPRMEQYMKDNHPWENETGSAERGLYAEFSVIEEAPGSFKLKLVLGHGVSYGIYLELGHNGIYQILRPTADVFRNEVVSIVRNAWRE